MTPEVERLFEGAVLLGQREHAHGVMESLRAHQKVWEQRAAALVKEYGPRSGTAIRALFEDIVAGPSARRARHGYEGFDGQRIEPCSTCGRVFTQAEWDALPGAAGGSHLVLPPYPAENDPGEVLEMKNCGCHSTLTVLEPFSAIDIDAEVGLIQQEMPGINLKNARALAIGRLKQRFG